VASGHDLPPRGADPPLPMLERHQDRHIIPGQSLRWALTSRRDPEAA